MKSRNTVDPNRFAERLIYDPVSGDLVWKLRPESCWHHKTWNARFAGKVAGTIGTNGYRDFGLFGRLWKVHRVVWAIINNEWPNDEIDHINGNRSDNRIINLRQATREENCQNFPKFKNNTSGYIGVRRHPTWRRWQARIRVNGKRINIGMFDTPEEAYQAYITAKAKYHKYDASGRV